MQFDKVTYSDLDEIKGETLFLPDHVITLAAMKSELFKLADRTEFYIADLGIPAMVYKHFHIKHPREFKKSGLLHCKFCNDYIDLPTSIIFDLD